MIGTDIQKAAALLQAGEVIGMPTETVYGLAGNALNAQAVAKIFAIKKRPTFDPLIVHIFDLSQIELLSKSSLSESFYVLANRFWPGPLTLVVEKSDAVPDIVTSGLSTVGIRMPAHPMAQQLLRLCNLPLAAPSANPFGYISPVTAEHVARQLGDQVPYILDGGRCQIGLESTIVDCTVTPARILRKGGISVEKIAEALGYQPDVLSHSTDNPKAPGMLSSHYAPRKKLILTDQKSVFSYYHNKNNIAFLRYRTPIKQHPIQRILSPNGSDAEAAANLFYFLRELDEMSEIDLIVAEKAPDKGLGPAINDRLQRAATEVI
ncbi:threonylcarbamoyl-AMP synthase [Thermaurantimonas aggregans]|uniref:Threonylcarbamoyl-AMP synthase n=1 Tax=Thermaurantimonas aggregans TaxID=2173829 RepID=A0A401XJF7_9FLAO|nr:L-threonylcarbamoyladenylate synthase [Thermaurantimonas aggregans]MCX8148700.1 L-threonylcarbamoyladenylate synthase [Thermaurantimonas aggregans]GCD77165.1 threonylcarbamoyl-AMP synthase [Thermaurantimonas aggregans]